MAKAGKPRPIRRLRVLRKEQLTPHMIRIVAGGEGLRGYQHNEFTDAYVKVIFPVAGAEYPEPLDLGAIKAALPREQWPSTRTYTVRQYDELAGELTLDFVCHGDTGLAGPWAAAAAPGDELLLSGPGGAYAPDPAADWHLLVGDESALPAIGAALEAMPPGALVHAFVLVEDAAERQSLSTKADAQVRWLHRSAGEDLVGAVRELEFPAGDVQPFVHGEAGFVRELRRYLLTERGVAKERLSLSGYWRVGKNDEEWREEKAAERATERTT
ncbi:siderophore-interacting protein [Saccharopolyspora sp. MS10]|uniref:siderophore-interacting protein n=1 Tax=Saccharopolyspora sp. MS10 TaxID=3385973 RepID=UPI00399F73EF